MGSTIHTGFLCHLLPEPYGWNGGTNACGETCDGVVVMMEPGPRSQ